MLAAAMIVSLAATTPEWLGPAKTPPRQCMRIISLAPALTETLFALGRGERVVGVTRFDNWPAAVHGLPRVGGFVDPEPEAVLALHPDLIVASPVGGARHRLEALARLGAPVLLLPCESLAELWQAIATLGSLTDAEQPARELSERLQGELASQSQRSQRATPRRVLIVVGFRPLIAAGPGSFLDSLLPHVGAVNALGRGEHFVQLDLEAVAAARPDVIIETGSEEQPPAGFWSRVVPALLPHTRIARVPADVVVRPGPRLLEGTAALLEALGAEGGR
jgi:iron complex transport system substrate-binding protein